MPSFTYYCTALLDAEGRSIAHDIDVPQERVDSHEGIGSTGEPVMSKMGNLESKPGQPPVAVFCEEHRGWASLQAIHIGLPR